MPVKWDGRWMVSCVQRNFATQQRQTNTGYVSSVGFSWIIKSALESLWKKGFLSWLIDWWKSWLIDWLKFLTVQSYLLLSTFDYFSCVVYLMPCYTLHCRQFLLDLTDFVSFWWTPAFWFKYNFAYMDLIILELPCLVLWKEQYKFMIIIIITNNRRRKALWNLKLNFSDIYHENLPSSTVTMWESLIRVLEDQSGALH